MIEVLKIILKKEILKIIIEVLVTIMKKEKISFLRIINIFTKKLIEMKVVGKEEYMGEI